VTVYVDDIRIPAQVGRFNAKWSHLIADSREELFEFADRLGLRRSYFQDPVVNGKPKATPGTLHAEMWHFDVTESVRLRAIRMGAVAVPWHDLPGIIEARFVALGGLLPVTVRQPSGQLGLWDAGADR
jgi:uncharacterized protein DUF4031